MSAKLGLAKPLEHYRAGSRLGLRNDSQNDTAEPACQRSCYFHHDLEAKGQEAIYHFPAPEAHHLSCDLDIRKSPRALPAAEPYNSPAALAERTVKVLPPPCKGKR